MHCAGEQTGEMRSGVIEDILISYVQIRGAAIEVDVIRRKQLRTGADQTLGPLIGRSTESTEEGTSVPYYFWSWRSGNRSPATRYGR